MKYFWLPVQTSNAPLGRLLIYSTLVEWHNIVLKHCVLFKSIRERYSRPPQYSVSRYRPEIQTYFWFRHLGIASNSDKTSDSIKRSKPFLQRCLEKYSLKTYFFKVPKHITTKNCPFCLNNIIPKLGDVTLASRYGLQTVRVAAWMQIEKRKLLSPLLKKLENCIFCK